MSKIFPRANATYKAGKLHEAATMLREALRVSPDHAPSFHLLGIIEVRLQRQAVALKCFEAAIKLEPRNPAYLMARANVVASMGQPGEAIAAYEQALSIDPKMAEAHANKGQALRLLGRLPEALECFRLSTTLKPEYIDAHCFLADACTEIGDFESAIRAYTQTLVLNPAHVSALLNRGTCQLNLSRWEKALADYDRVISLMPDQPEAQGRRAQALLELERFQPALASADRAVTLQPEKSQWLVLRGRALHGLERTEEAVADFHRAQTMKGSDADSLVALGVAYMQLEEFDKALDYFDRGIRINPTIPIWFYNRGCLLQRLRRFEEAISNYDEAIARDPNHASAYWNLSLSLLVQGNPRGWDHYEWRWKVLKGGGNPESRPRKIPAWQGFESIEGKRILLTAEQGLGDTLMFCRYAARLIEMGAVVSFAVPKPLVRILASIPGIQSIHAFGTDYDVSEFDYFCPFMSLPRIFRTTLHTIPSGTQRYLFAEPRLIDQWKATLAAAGVDFDRPRVGIMWSGRVVKSLGLRSVDLPKMLEAQVPGVQFISLQKEIPDSDRALAAERGVKHFGDEQQDFADAAAIVELVDLVVSIDTSIAHLAGALGKETWIMLRYDSEWRWLEHRTDSPWYPNARLIRQPSDGDWDSVLAEIKLGLERQFP